MTGRAVDQILPCPSDPKLHEQCVQSALEYLAMAERANGPIPKPVTFSYIWGDALEEIERAMPAARIVNLETSVTTSAEFESKGINYRMHPANISCLSVAKIDCCALANNHVLDWGKRGLADTIRALRRAGMQTTGAGENLDEAWRPAAIDIGGGARVLVLAAGTGDSGIPPDWEATPARPGIARLPDLSDGTAAFVAGRLRSVKCRGDIAVLSIHWGGNWGYEIPRAAQAFARKLIDVGAIDIVHGHSSHHPKAIEVYKDAPIFYGCGDFLNDYEGIRGYGEFRSHLVLAFFATIDRDTKRLLRLEMAPFTSRGFQLRRAKASEAAWLRDRLAHESAPLGVRVSLDGRNRLVVSWQRRGGEGARH